MHKKSKSNSNKLCILGKAGTGKTSLSRRLTQKEKYRHNYYQESTIGAAFTTTKYKDEEGNESKIDIWDTAGQERYRALAPMYYRAAAGAIIVYDITNKESWEDIYYWVEELKNNRDENLPILIVGNKYDMKKKMEVDCEKINKYCKDKNITNIFCSALDGYNCEKILELMVKKIQEKPLNILDTQLDKNTELLDKDKDRTYYYNCCL